MPDVRDQDSKDPAPTSPPPDHHPLGFGASAARIAEAASLMPGGVGSDFRLGMSPTPLVVTRGEGPYLWDLDGNRLIDYYLGMGPMILGHSPTPVIEAAARQLNDGLLFAAQTELEYRAGALVVEMVPCAEMVRFGSSGTEVVQAALRVARAATDRSTILAFEGHYHGWLDNVMWTRTTEGELVPASLGQDSSAGQNIELLPWNDIDILSTRLRRGDAAGVIMEPSMCNSGAIRPLPGYLEEVRDLCDETGTVLIFDEVITGFRIAPGGAQELLGVVPDLATFGKAIAAGFPVSCLAGRRNLMELIGGPGRVIHAGTYNAQSVSMAATVATLETLRDGEVHATLEERGTRLMTSLDRLFGRHGVKSRVQGWPQIFHVAFGTDEPIRDFRPLANTDRASYVRFTTALLHRGVRALERGAWFLSTAHDDSVVDETLDAVEHVLAQGQ